MPRTNISRVLTNGLIAPEPNQEKISDDKIGFADKVTEVYGDECFVDDEGCLWCKNEDGEYELKSCPV